MFVFFTESHDSGNFYFCFRWILILFKREFSFPDVQRLWEVRILIVRLGFITFKSHMLSVVLHYSCLIFSRKTTWAIVSKLGTNVHLMVPNSMYFLVPISTYHLRQILILIGWNLKKKKIFLALLHWTMCENIWNIFFPVTTFNVDRKKLRLAIKS